MKFNKLILNNLALTLFLTNISFDSIASNRILNENNTKEFKTYQQIADNDDIWLEGFANMPTGRSGLSSVLIDGKIYCFGGYKGNSSHMFGVKN